MTSQSAIDALLIEGISYKQRPIAIHGRDPFANRGPATKITITGFRMKGSDSQLLDYLKPLIIGAELEIDKERYTAVNCYGPANRQERPSFLDSLNNVISNLYQNNLIICGDFNMVQNNSLDTIFFFFFNNDKILYFHFLHPPDVSKNRNIVKNQSWSAQKRLLILL